MEIRRTGTDWHKGRTAPCSVPRILLAAPASGSGKTTVCCGLLELFRRRGMSLVSFKCGPDYIDPAFHSHVLGIRGYNLDSFFLDEKEVDVLFRQKAAGADLAVMEGVMGYYDGVAGTSTRASTYHIAAITDTPVILVVDGKKSSLSLAALVKGFLEYRPDSRIGGVILNRTGPAMEQRLRPYLEELGVACLGAVPECGEARLESRHLGLVLPWEQNRLKEQTGRLADRLEGCLDVEGILELAGMAAGEDREGGSSGKGAGEGGSSGKEDRRVISGGRGAGKAVGSRNRRMAVAMDEAFCFYYQENLEFLQDHGWEPVPFSPVHDQGLPEHVDGILLGGGYPECYARELSENQAMLKAVQAAAAGGVKILAECGGFLYLHAGLEGMDGKRYPMAGLIPAEGFRAEKQTRFGYVTLEQKGTGQGNPARETGAVTKKAAPEGEVWSSGKDLPRQVIRGHEFHYWDSTAPGEAMTAAKPLTGRTWPCMYVTRQMIAGFPHLYYPSGASWILDFLDGA